MNKTINQEMQLIIKHFKVKSEIISFSFWFSPDLQPQKRIASPIHFLLLHSCQHGLTSMDLIMFTKFLPTCFVVVFGYRKQNY